jgi:hypothetical protein
MPRLTFGQGRGCCNFSVRPRPVSVTIHPALFLAIPDSAEVLVMCRLCRSLVALVLLAAAAPGAEIYPLKGDAIKGDIVRVTDTEVVFKQGDKQVTRPVKEVLRIDFRDVAKPAAGTTWTQVELTDGTVLLASKWLLKKRELELTLLAGPVIKLPIAMVSNILNQGNVDTHQRDWKTRLFNTRGREAVVVKSEGIISNLDATLGDGDEAGTSITFAVTIEGETSTQTRKLSTIHGLIFKHVLDTKASKVTCKLLDTMQDVVMVSSLVSKEGGFTVTTPGGAKLDFTNEQIARLDYTKGRLDYLSELKPIKLVQKSNLDEDGKPDQWHVYTNTNLNKGTLTLGGVTYKYGLAVKPYVEMTWDLKGEYRELSMVIGIDDNVSAVGGTTIVFERDGKEIATETISSEDKKRHKEVTLNIRDAQKLRIIVKSDGEFDTSRHLDLADAKVSK